jgi:hydroxymethylbilane synthase
MTTLLAPRRLTIATRESALALWQAEHVRARLTSRYPGTAVDLLGVTTQGDRVIDRPLAMIGGKGLFIKELENALREGRADIAVHSLKDVPMDMPDGFVLAAISAREDARDAFVSNRFDALSSLPPGTVVGTSSLRREAQLRERHPEIRIESLRGNVHTRLRKLDEGCYGAIILAAAGLKRLGLGTRIRALLDPDVSLPAPGQGALAIECRTDRVDLVHALAALADRGTTLGGSCQTPLAAYAEWQEGRLWLRGLLAGRDGRDVLRGEMESVVTDIADAQALGAALADDFIGRGGHRLAAASA